MLKNSVKEIVVVDKRNIFRKLTVFITSFSLVIQSVLPGFYAFTPRFAYAQEVEATPTISQDVTPTEIPAPTLTPEVSLKPSEAPVPTENPIPTPTSVSDWQDTVDKTSTTKDNVTTDYLYTAPQNDKVTVKFNKLPDNKGKLTIKEVTLTDQQIAQTKALSNIAYDISSDMINGTFEYALTLPTPKTENVEVKASEDGQSFVTVGGVSAQTDILTITGLNHFTIFVVTGTIAQVDLVYTSNLFSESPNGVVINEFVFHPSSNNEWIELYNTGSSPVNLTGWTLKDGNNINDDLTLSGTIPANGILVFESNASGWLNNLENNTNGDTITLRNSENTIISQVTYQKGEGVTEVAGFASSFGDMSPGQSIGRIISETGITWQAYTTPTKGWFNDAGEGEGKAPLLSEIDNALSDQGIDSNIGELDNPSNTPSGDSGLYFLRAEGKILFTSNLNLTNQATVAVLQSLGEKMEMADGHIKFDSQTATDMVATGAKIYMYELSYPSTPDIIIKNDAGDMLGTNDATAIENINYDSNTGILSFNAKHFTQFDLATANNPPSFDAISNPTISEDSSAQNIAITNISEGTNESGQTVTFSATSSNTSVIPNPVVSGSGSNRTLTYTPAANANGSAIITVTANDGQAQNNTSSRTFTITVNAVNDTPSFTKGDNKTISEDAGAQSVSSWATSISKGSANESSQTLSFIVANNNNSLFSAQPAVAASGTLTYTPAANANGSSTITVSLQDNGGTTNGGNDTSATQTFTISVQDTTKPTNVTVSDSGTLTNNPHLVFTWLAATDLASGISYYQFWLSTFTNESSALDLNIDSSNKWKNVGNVTSYTLIDSEAALLSTGIQYFAKVKAVDNEGNIANTSVSSWSNGITLDATAPATPVITTPAQTVKTDIIHIIGTAEADSTVTITGGVSTVTGTATGGNYDITVALTHNAMNNLSVTAKDAAGNESSTAIVDITHDNVVPTVTKLGDNSTDYILSAGNTNLVFSEILSASSKTAVTNSLTAGADKALTYSWSGGTLTITTTEIPTFANDVVVNASDVVGNTADSLLLVDSKLETTQATPDNSGDVTIDSTTPQVVINNPTQAVDVTISSGTIDPTIDVSSFISGGTGTLPKITIDSEKADIVIPASTVVTSADATWNGVIAAPTVTTVALPETSGETKTLSSAIEIGFTGAKLSFDKAVRILLPNQAGKRAGYTRTGTAFTEITSTCTADNQAIGDALVADGDCKIDVGLDLVIWTKHFTKFATYTQTTNLTSSSSSSSGGGGVGDGKSDGLGCASHDCSGGGGSANTASPQSQVLGAATQLAAAFGFPTEVLGENTESEESVKVEKTDKEEVLGIKDTTQAENPSNIKTFGLIGIILFILIGFGFFFIKTH